MLSLGLSLLKKCILFKKNTQIIQFLNELSIKLLSKARNFLNIAKKFVLFRKHINYLIIEQIMYKTVKRGHKYSQICFKIL